MSARARAGWLLAGAALLGALWLCSPAARPDADDARQPKSPAAHDAAPRAARAIVPPLLATAGQAPEPNGAHERPADGRPHPLTPEHLRLYRDVDLLRAAASAIKAGNYDEARELVAQHHRELGGMSAPEEEGLLLLADCVERRSASNVARVQRFYDEHTDSTLRRRLRRSCLEAREPPQ